MIYYDFGCKKGSSSLLCRQLGGTDGTGLDLNQAYVDECIESGRKAILCDVTNTGLPSKSADFVCISHVLEHLDSTKKVHLAVQEAVRLSRSFVYIVGPWFEHDDFLESLGFKFFWSDWTWHPTPVRHKDIASALEEMSRPSSLSMHDPVVYFYARIPIVDTNHKCIHPLSSPGNQHDYDPSVHPLKSHVIQLKGVYREMASVIPVDLSVSHLNCIVESQGLIPVEPRIAK